MPASAHMTEIFVRRAVYYPVGRDIIEFTRPLELQSSLFMTADQKTFKLMWFCMHHIRMPPRANNDCLPKYYHPLSLCNGDSVCNVEQELNFCTP
jgi:hypothetical protein